MLLLNVFKYIVKYAGYVDSRKLGWLRRFVPCTTSIYTKKRDGVNPSPFKILL